MTPLKDDDSSEFGCYDKDGFLTKSIGNQKTCFFALRINDSESFHESEIYSGPLISSELPNIWSNIFKLNLSCYTSVKNTAFNRFDLCFYIPSNSSGSVFICCCSKEANNCRIDPDEKKKLLCAPPEFTNKTGQPILYSMKRYLRESENLPMFRIAYFSSNSCFNETTIDISESRFCSSEAVRPQKIKIHKCCQNGHFCNLNLTAFKRKEVKPYKCAYKPDISFHFDESTTCELYYDLTLEKSVYLHENFTTKIIHRTLDSYKEIKKTDGKTVGYSCSYIYAEIINVDSKDCKQNYNEMGSIKPFYYCLCGERKCDVVTTMSLPKKGFECETVMRTNINYINIGITAAKDKWICFVTTEFFTESSKIEAGHVS
uniref:Uncharacterized protein n=1 Tax=Panagrolaimus sp. PS1159 TaxID=55785 RepID=A0AC35GQ83_9BILA